MNAKPLVISSLLFLACGQPQVLEPRCDTSNCSGCCDRSASSNGVCVTATTANSCGAGGQACFTCASGMQCVSGQGTCDFVPDTLPTGAGYVFVTSGTFDGNLGGIAGADQKCQAAAAGGNLTGTFKAWISDLNDLPNDPARPTVNAVDRITAAGPWYLPCRTAEKKLIRAFNNKAQLGGTPLLSLNCTEQAAPVPVGSPAGVWTGTSTGGTAKSLQDSSGDPRSNCRGWKDNGSGFSLAAGVSGSINDPASNWTDVGSTPRNCVNLLRLYCVQN
jgi:hypothetical protein